MYSCRPTAHQSEHQWHGNTVLSQHSFQQDGVHVILGYVMGPKVGLRFLEHLSNLSLKRKHFLCVTSDDFFILTYLMAFSANHYYCY